MTSFAPFSDAVDALRALKALLAEALGDLGALEEARRAKHVKSALREFYFPPDGMRGVLHRIAEQNSTADFAELQQRFRQTDSAVARARSRLQRYRGSFGATSLEALEAVLLLQDGKFGLRQDIERLISDFPGADGSEEEMRTTAKILVAEIEAFNDTLIALHDAIEPTSKSLAPLEIKSSRIRRRPLRGS